MASTTRTNKATTAFPYTSIQGFFQDPGNRTGGLTIPQKTILTVYFDPSYISTDNQGVNGDTLSLLLTKRSLVLEGEK
jgi:hypothetical protein